MSETLAKCPVCGIGLLSIQFEICREVFKKNALLQQANLLSF